MTFGITTTGLNTKTLSDIILETEAEFKTSFGDAINLEGNSPLGQIKGVLDERISLLWELSEAIYNSQYPNTAEGTSLDNIASINNITRLQATKSQVTATITGTANAIVPANFIAYVNGNESSEFETLQEYTIGSGGTVDVEMYATNTGETVAYSGTLTEIQTPTSGIDSITNALDAELGRDVETDTDFKIRRLLLLQRSGTATIEGIRNNLISNVDDVTNALVVENNTLTTDSNGRPPKSIEVYVLGGLNADIASSIFNSKPAGISTYGTITETVLDSQAQSHSISFSRSTEIDIYLIVNITKNTDISQGDVYPTDGDTKIENEILAYTSNLNISDDVIVNKLYTPINNVSGVIGIEIFIGTSASPTTSTNIAINVFEIAVFDSSRITINS
jgi:uncharacterized phage protein gp47/JayE